MLLCGIYVAPSGYRRLDGYFAHHTPVGAAEIEKDAGHRLAALALSTGPRAVTNVVKKLNEDFSPSLLDQLGATFLDARYRLVQALGTERVLYRQIVFATGWQESCWRQFIKKGEKLAPLASTTR